MTNDDEALRALTVKRDEVVQDFYSACCLAFPVDRHIEWVHGGHIRWARVLGISPASSFDINLIVVSRQNGGKPYKVNVNKVIDHMILREK